MFLTLAAVFVFSFSLTKTTLADQCIRGDCKANCSADEEPSTSPGDACSESYLTCCVPKACPNSSVLGCIASSSCDKPTPGGSCYASGQTCCDKEKTTDPCASSPDGTICTMSDGAEGACKNKACAKANYYDPCAGALLEGASCKTASGASGTCKNKACVSGGEVKKTVGKGDPGSGTGWNSSDLGQFGLPGTPLKDIIMGVLDWLLTIVGIIAVIALVISGFQYYMVATDEKMLETAKKTARAAVIGLVVALSGVIFIHVVDTMLNAGKLF